MKLIWKIHLAVFLSLVVVITLLAAGGIVSPVTAFSGLALAVLSAGLSLTIGHFTRPSPVVRDNLNWETAERRRIEEELRSSEERLRLLFEYAPDAYFLHDSQGRILDVNRKAEHLIGFTREEQIGHSITDLGAMPPGEEDRILAATAKSTAGQAGEPEEVILRRKDGTFLHVEVVTLPTHIKGEPVVLGIARDVSGRKKAEEELRESRAKYLDLFQNANDGIITMDLTGRLTSFNHAAAALHGYSEDEFAHLTMQELLTPESCAQASELLQVALARGSDLEEAQPWEVRLVKKDGTILDAEVRTSLIRRQGQIVGIHGIARDVTGRKRAEEALRKSEAQLSNALKIAKLGAWELDVESGMFAFTDSFYAIFRTTAKDVGGYQMSVADYARRFVHPEDSALVGLETRRALETDDPNYSRYLEHRMLYADGSVGHIAVRFFIVKDHRGKTIKTYGVNQDITERKQVERKQTQLLEQLTAANQELKDFAYVISHDLKAPLRAIGTIADWLSSDYAGRFDEQGREYLTLLGNRVTRMQNLIDGVLQYSRIGRTEQGLAPVDLSRLLPEIVESLGVPDHIVVEVQPDLPTVEADTTRITQVFQNLLSNAIKYMDKPQGQIAVVCEEEGTFWKFRVTDNGPGIEPIHFERIFKLFQTLAPRDTKESTGVGLTIAKKIVEMYGGRIWVESEVGRGSTFFFTFPRRQTSEMEPMPEAAAPGPGGAELAVAEAGHPLTPAGPLERS